MEDFIPFFVGIGLDKENDQVVMLCASQDKSECVKKCKIRWRGRPIFIWGFDEDPVEVADNIKNWLTKNEVPQIEHANIIALIADAIESKIMAGKRMD